MNHGRYLRLASREAALGNCHGHKVGAVLTTAQGAIITAAHNGTPVGMVECLDGGCARCANREAFGPGLLYDMCVCVHAEQNVLLQCSKAGVSTQGTIVYTTLRPCLGCCKEMINAGVFRVYYVEEWELRAPMFQNDYKEMLHILGATQLTIQPLEGEIQQ